MLAILQIPHHIQTWLLYHNALSSDVVVSNILRYARKSQESGRNAPPNEDLIEQISELRKVVQKQEDLIESLGRGLKPVEQDSSTNAIMTQHNPTNALDQHRMGRRTVSAPMVDVGGVAYDSPFQSPISSSDAPNNPLIHHSVHLLCPVYPQV